MIPHPITEPDLNVRTLSAYDCEKTLVAFIEQIVDAYRFDNPTLNLAQPTTVPFDYKERAQTLELKQPPRVERGRVPRTVTGEIAVDKLPDFPAVIVQAVAARAEIQSTTLTVRIFVNMYDENPDSSGYQDCLNLTEALTLALTTFGQGAIDKSYTIIMPIDWRLVEPDTFPHYIAEITTQWELPSGRPMPDIPDGIIPAEHLHFNFETLRQ